MRAFALLLLLTRLVCAETRRVVVIKVDGLPAGLVEEALLERNPRTGRSRLPWIEEIFGKHGTRIANFYTRGISLSAPSWAMLDTGQHQRIHGNVEFERSSLRPYDYLNFFPFYLGNAGRKREDMPGVEVLDAAGVPLIIDRFDPGERYQSFQLFQRGVRWKTLQRSLQNRFTLRSPRQLFDEWQTGFEFTSSVAEQTERELIEHLKDPHYRYLDYFSGDFDHTAHLTNDRAAQLHEIEATDRLIGRIWTAIRNSQLAEQTVLALVSDHGFNSVEGTYSQGYSLVDWFRSAAGGGHHVGTDRYPLSEYKIRGLNPLVSTVITPSPDSPYLKEEAQEYPTVFLDLDGNERAAVQLRNSDVNELHILLKRIRQKETSAGAREEAITKFLNLRDAKREAWSKRKPQRLSNLLSIERSRLEARQFRIDELIPKLFLGETNTIFDLQNYVMGPDESQRIDYFRALRQIAVRNNVQNGVAAIPVDFIAARTDDGIWLYSDTDHQALVMSRHTPSGDLELRYMPVADLRGHEDGSVSWWATGWKRDLPLRIWEDGQLTIPSGSDREAWLSGWHTDGEWLRATHHTRYSNGVVGIHEQFVDPAPDRNVEPDLLLFANDHWNFNSRGFNPGGNHGSFFRISTHSVLMFAGGGAVGIGQGQVVTEPYDSLSFAPTLLKLAGREYANLPGPLIRELFIERGL